MASPSFDKDSENQKLITRLVYTKALPDISFVSATKYDNDLVRVGQPYLWLSQAADSYEQIYQVAHVNL